MKNWYTGLSSIQKDPLAPFHNNDSKPLIKHAAYADIRNLLTTALPQAYAFGSAADWSADYTTEYVERVKGGKRHIETNAPQIGKLIVDFKNGSEHSGNRINYEGELILQARTDDGRGKIYYTDDGSDPVSSQQRKQLEPGKPMRFRGNRKLRMTVADGKGNYSAVQTYEIVDELEKYSIKHTPQKKVFDEMVSFVFPQTKEASQTTIRSFIKALQESGLYSKAELRQALQKELDSLK